jgi:hypothetical protein
VPAESAPQRAGGTVAPPAPASAAAAPDGPARTP